MTIKQQGGIFGRNPTFNNVTVDGTLTVDQIVEKTGAAGITLDGVTLKDGNVVLADGKGIDFSATAGTGTSELFDDYEEGTWTPVLTFVTAGDVSVTYSNQIGTYVKIGKSVILTCRVTTSAFTHSTASGGLRISGMPFSAASRHYAALLFNGINKASYTTILANTDTGSSVISFGASGMGQNQAGIVVADVPSGGTPFIQFTLSYEVS